MSFTKILCPIDFSEGSHKALRVAIRIAREAKAELAIVHSWHFPAAAYPMEAPISPVMIQTQIDEGEAAMARAVEEASSAGVENVTRKLLKGTPWAEIVEELDRHPYDLCVIGTHGRTGLARVLLGSVAQRVVRLAPCSVLAVRAAADVAPFHHALVPTDFSPSATYALDLATGLVVSSGSITLLNAVEFPVPIDLGPELVAQARKALEAECARVRTKATQDVSGQVHEGGAVVQVLAALDADKTIELIVMGSHGRTGIKRAILGSVAERTVRHARCPVLVARQRI